MFTLLLSTAFALDCGPSDACADANAIRDGINGLTGQNTITDTHSKAKRRTVQVFNRISAIYDAADAGGCSIDGIDYVTSSGGAFSGSYDNVDASGGSQSGSFGGGVITGTYTGDESGDIGDWGRYVFKTGKLGALRGDGFLMGGLVRLSGSNAVAYGVHGTCETGVDIAAVFSDYMPQLAQYETEEEPVDPFPGDYELVSSTCDAFALPEDGVLTVLADLGSGYALEVEGAPVTDTLGQPVLVTETGANTYAYTDGVVDVTAVYDTGTVIVDIEVPLFAISCTATGQQL